MKLKWLRNCEAVNYLKILLFIICILWFWKKKLHCVNRAILQPNYKLMEVLMRIWTKEKCIGRITKTHKLQLSMSLQYSSKVLVFDPTALNFVPRGHQFKSTKLIWMKMMNRMNTFWANPVNFWLHKLCRNNT